MVTYDFEKPIVEHETRIADLRKYAQEAQIDERRREVRPPECANRRTCDKHPVE